MQTKIEILKEYFTSAHTAEKYLKALDNPNLSKYDRSEIEHLLDAYNRILARFEDRHPWITKVLTTLDSMEG